MARKPKDLTGNVYGRLTVLEFSHTNKYRVRHWRCLCSCGKETVVQQGALNSRKGCGCVTKERMTTHGEASSKIYKHYMSMLTRCKTREDCDNKFESYLHFKGWSLNNGYKEHLHLCRNGDKGNYSPENSRWDTVTANIVEANANTYTVLNPVGSNQVVYNLAEFCRKNSLNEGGLHRTFRTGKPHKGWLLIEKHGMIKPTLKGEEE